MGRSTAAGGEVAAVGRMAGSASTVGKSWHAAGPEGFSPGLWATRSYGTDCQGHVRIGLRDSEVEAG